MNHSYLTTISFIFPTRASPTMRGQVVFLGFQSPIWRFPEIAEPLNHQFFVGFSIINHPFWRYPHLWKPSYNIDTSSYKPILFRGPTIPNHPILRQATELAAPKTSTNAADWTWRHVETSEHDGAMWLRYVG